MYFGRKAANNSTNLSVGNALRGHRVQWHTDNQNIVFIIVKGSMKPDLQSIAEDIGFMSVPGIVSQSFQPGARGENHIADYLLSKLTDVNDWGIPPHIFQWMNNMWDPFTVDRFATSYNAKMQ